MIRRLLRKLIEYVFYIFLLGAITGVLPCLLLGYIFQMLGI